MVLVFRPHTTTVVGGAAGPHSGEHASDGHPTKPTTKPKPKTMLTARQLTENMRERFVPEWSAQSSLVTAEVGSQWGENLRQSSISLQQLVREHPTHQR
jgi:hypothetical protein